MNWNKERLIEKYMDNASAVSVAAGISPPSKVPPSAAGPDRSQGVSSSARSVALRRPARQTPGMLLSASSRSPLTLTLVQLHLPNRSPLCARSAMTTHKPHFRHSRVTTHSVPDVGMPTSHPRFGRRASTRSGVWPKVVEPLHQTHSFIPLWGTTSLPGNVSTSSLCGTLSVPTPI